MLRHASGALPRASETPRQRTNATLSAEIADDFGVALADVEDIIRRALRGAV
jgi:hypothetical protein